MFQLNIRSEFFQNVDPKSQLLDNWIQLKLHMLALQQYTHTHTNKLQLCNPSSCMHVCMWWWSSFLSTTLEFNTILRPPPSLRRRISPFCGWFNFAAIVSFYILKVDWWIGQRKRRDYSSHPHNTIMLCCFPHRFYYGDFI